MAINIDLYLNVSVGELGSSELLGTNYQELSFGAATYQPVITDPGGGQIGFSLDLLLELKRIFITNIVRVVIGVDDASAFFSGLWKVIVEYNEEYRSQETSLRYALFSNFSGITELGLYNYDLFPSFQI